MRIKTSSTEQSLQSMEQTSLSTQRQAIYLNKNLHTSLFILFGAYFMSPRISWLLKAAKEKILSKLPVCIKEGRQVFNATRTARIQKGLLELMAHRIDGNCSHTLTWTPQGHVWAPSRPEGGVCSQKTSARTFAAPLPKYPAMVSELGCSLTVEYSTATSMETQPQP